MIGNASDEVHSKVLELGDHLQSSALLIQRNRTSVNVFETLSLMVREIVSTNRQLSLAA